MSLSRQAWFGPKGGGGTQSGLVIQEASFFGDNYNVPGIADLIFPTAPTAGNYLVFFAGQINSSAVTLPSGLTALTTSQGSNGGTDNNTTWLQSAYRKVQSGDSTTWTFGYSQSSTIAHSIALYGVEIAAGSLAGTFVGAIPSTNPWTAGSPGTTQSVTDVTVFLSACFNFSNFPSSVGAQPPLFDQGISGASVPPTLTTGTPARVLWDWGENTNYGSMSVVMAYPPAGSYNAAWDWYPVNSSNPDAAMAVVGIS